MASNISGLETFDTGSNYPFNNEQPSARPPRDLFNLSHLHTTTIDNAGLVIPIAFWKTVPGDSFDISVSSLLRVLPQVVPLYSRQRGYVHAFYARYSDLFDYAPSYMTKGYSGTSIMRKPVMTSENMGDYWEKKISAGDLLNYLGLPLGYSPKEITDVVGDFLRLPAFMYWKIVNQYYRNKNTQINDRVRLPDDFSELRLNRESNLISNRYADSNTPKQTFGELLYRDWSSDYFTSGFPAPQRGVAPTLQAGASFEINSSIDASNALSDFNQIQGYSQASTQPFFGIFSHTSGDEFPHPSLSVGRVQDSGETSIPTVEQGIAVWKDFFSKLDVNSVPTSGVSLGVTLENIRSLSIAQDELERMAKTDGTFAAFGSVFFGVVSRNALDYVVQYIGGSYQQINFSEVVQSSQSTEQSPLGNYAGHGISSQQNGNLGHVDCDEQGYVMILFSVMPDTYYSQGIDQEWTQLLQDEEFLPQREKMGLVPVYTRELFFSQETTGVGSDSYKANDLFVYQSPFDNMRYMSNRISGKIADKDNKSFSPYTQARLFDTTPEWNSDFLLAKNVRKDYLSAPSEIAYTAQFQFNIRAVRPLPFFHTPAQVIN